MAGYRAEIDICNRALQLCRLNSITAFSNQNWPAIETSFAYDKMRVAALEGNLWAFATRRIALRAVDTVTAVLETNASTASGDTLPFDDTTGIVVGQLVQGTNIAAGSTVASFVADTSATLSLAIGGTVAAGAAISFGPLTMLWTPPAYAAITTYALGEVVLYDTEWWQSKVAGNLGNTPASGNYWRRYVGPDSLQAYAATVSYFPGELALGTDGIVYLALIAADVGHDPLTTTGFWLAVNGTVGPLTILYPLGSGPFGDTSTANVYRLPRGFLRRAPTAPKAGIGSWLGVPTGLWREDDVYEGGYIVSNWRGGIGTLGGFTSLATGFPAPLMRRYVADVIDVLEFDRLFCEYLAGMIAEAIAPQLAAQDTMQIVLANIARHLNTIRRQAIGTNGIEIGATDPPLDSYLTCRL